MRTLFSICSIGLSFLCAAQSFENFSEALCFFETDESVDSLHVEERHDTVSISTVILRDSIGFGYKVDSIGNSACEVLYWGRDSTSSSEVKTKFRGTSILLFRNKKIFQKHYFDLNGKYIGYISFKNREIDFVEWRSKEKSERITNPADFKMMMTLFGMW